MENACDIGEGVILKVLDWAEQVAPKSNEKVEAPAPKEAAKGSKKGRTGK
jgi:hypothetical protein